LGEAEAERDLERIRLLVDEGIAPRRQLEEAEARMRDARDRAVLEATLYGRIELSELTEGQAREMTAAAARMLERRQAQLDDIERKVEQGALARAALIPFQEEVDRALRTLDEATARAGLIEELSRMARREVEISESAESAIPDGFPPLAERFDGSGELVEEDWRAILLAYEARFRRGLPVSARGDTAYHRELGFDHRGRLDIALDPDSTEGAWLRHELEARQVPHHLFRAALNGSSSAPHIHVGPPSARLRPE
jgi:hypothetical protein